jgi:hypothetical protein
MLFSLSYHKVSQELLKYFLFVLLVFVPLSSVLYFAFVFLCCAIAVIGHLAVVEAL